MRSTHGSRTKGNVEEDDTKTVIVINMVATAAAAAATVDIDIVNMDDTLFHSRRYDIVHATSATSSCSFLLE